MNEMWKEMIKNKSNISPSAETLSCNKKYPILRTHRKLTYSSSQKLQQQPQNDAVNNHAQVCEVRESAAAGRLRHRDRRRLSGVGTRRLLVRRRRRLVETRRQAEAALALHTVAGVGEEVVRSNYGQRNNDGQRFAETTASAVVHEGSIVGIIGGAVQIGRLVVCLNHRLVRVRIEN